MRKEIIIAIIGGIIIGLAVAFGSWRANLAMQTKRVPETLQDASAVSEENAENEKIIESTDLGISLSSADNYDVITESPFALRGITKPGSLVVISGEKDDFILKAESDGSFEQNITLIEGVNQIVINSFTPQNEELINKLLIVYSPDFNKDLSNAGIKP